MMSNTGNKGLRREAPIPANEPALVCAEKQLSQPYHFWRGASGARYLHTVFALIDCPQLPMANYIFVRRDLDGARRPLDIGQTVFEAESLNLAHLRRRAALLGANEIHVHFLSESVRQRRAVEADLSARQLGRTGTAHLYAPANDGTEAVCA